MPRIFYAVVALKIGQVDEVVGTLRREGLGPAAEWLEKRKNDLYGKRNEDWRPFGDRTIEEMVLGAEGDFQSATMSLDAIKDDLSNIQDLEVGIDIYFIDLFALFLQKYKNLTERLDALLANSKKSCLVLGYGLLPEFELLMSRYSKVSPFVAQAYLKGSLHRIVVRPDDLWNFRNHVRTLLLPVDRPDPLTSQRLRSRLGPPQSLPTM